MNLLDLAAFAQRDWALVSVQEEEYWRERKRQFGPAEGLRVAGELLRQVRSQRPDWPSPTEREEDLATHVRVGQMLRRVVTI
jgi:hypothetical protein